MGSAGHAALTAARLLTAEAGSFALDGIAADLIYDGTPIVEPPAGGLSYGGGAAPSCGRDRLSRGLHNRGVQSPFSRQALDRSS